MNSARMVDKPISQAYNSKYESNVNGQNLIPEVFEAFSKTNNDLKQRYIALQKWASARTSSTEQELELSEEIKSLNELSDMVHLVNNLEKDMLKTILKRKRRLGVSIGSKHEIIPSGRDSKRKSSKRFTNPNDVQELLQYIYDTYIENRTADDIPVVLQAFQKSVTDIVAKKSINSNKNYTVEN